MTDDSGTWSFEYNADGLRVYRSNGTSEYKYYYNGDKLSRMVVNGQNITFGYDANGTPQYVLYEGNRYFYLTNLQGDVTAIVSVNGNVVVEYSYDAWGNVLDITGVRADNLGKLNPLRYRGYVYDEETGLYYLQSRYYDPLIGRFINADVYTSTGQGFVGNNMFAYCGNNPAVYTDPTGSAFVGLGAQFDISTGAYECGVEVIVYWDKNVCSEGGPIVSVYTYEGMSVNLDEVLVNPQYVNVVNQLTLAVSANAGKDYDTMELIGLQATLFGTNASASVVGIWGYDNFDSTDDYAGPFTSYSGNYNHVKATWSYCDTCWSIAVGGTTETRPHLSFGQTNYTEVYNSSSR